MLCVCMYGSYLKNPGVFGDKSLQATSDVACSQKNHVESMGIRGEKLVLFWGWKCFLVQKNRLHQVSIGQFFY